MKACRRCGGRATGFMHVLVDDGAVLKGRLRDRRLAPAKKRVPGAELCAACFAIADEEFKLCKAEHESLVLGGMSQEEAAAEMLRRFDAFDPKPTEPTIRGVSYDQIIIDEARTWRPGPEAA